MRLSKNRRLLLTKGAKPLCIIRFYCFWFVRVCSLLLNHTYESSHRSRIINGDGDLSTILPPIGWYESEFSAEVRFYIRMYGYEKKIGSFRLELRLPPWNTL